MVYLICGKICSGKSYYARQLKQEHRAVILSTDEATSDLINNEQGEFYNVFARRVNGYLMKKAAEIDQAGADVILDWGFWTRADRQAISQYLAERGVTFQWHYMDVSEERWQAQIDRRNRRVLAGEGGSDFYVDEGLLNKVKARFEAPQRSEMDVWVTLA